MSSRAPTRRAGAHRSTSCQHGQHAALGVAEELGEESCVLAAHADTIGAAWEFLSAQNRFLIE